jgi:mono/diheme cytochrome c family protein
MRVFLFIFGVCVVLVMLIAGKRGDLSRRPPIEIFPDMDRQLKLRPQTPNSFFPDGLSSQLPPPGTVAQTGPMLVGGRPVYPHQDDPVNTGRVPGTTNFVELNPLPVTAPLLARGRERYTIYCTPCHGATGDGNGITKKIGAMAVVASLHDKRIVELPDGDLFNTITHGKNLMGGYGPQIPVEDRWAIVAYVRALQLSHLGAVDDLPPELRAKLK